ncbi:MAG: hypothetical protein JWQ07_3399 [Ramlibacter sp.]|nr:hypothetical protein [Ramlibacter sp.]
MIDRRRLLQASAALGVTSPVLSSFAALPASLPADQAAAHALNRLGFGPRPGDLAIIAQGPQTWIELQLQPQSLPLPAGLAARLGEERFVGGDPIAAVREFLTLVRDNRAVAAAAQPAQAAQDTPLGSYVRSHQLPAVESRLFRALESPRQLEEVMVDFWFNHFNVYQAKNFMRVLVGYYEHQAIRPFALGRFRDLLGATAHHPAMLYYLDNSSSVGPQAAARGRGLNENYARELMELHTLGVDGGYTQQDVTQLARMLTGWTYEPILPSAARFVRASMPARGSEMPGFWFNERLHDHGEKEWLGHRVAAQGQAEGEFALDVLARHPATARHIAFKLAQYFVSDRPPPALVDRLAGVFLAEDGQIVPVLRALFASDAFWAGGSVGAKFKTPYHYVLSVLRAGGYGVAAGGPVALHLAAEGMPLFGCQTPDGYKNTEAAWLSPDGLNKRLEFAAQVANGHVGRERLSGGLGAGELLSQLGPLVTQSTRNVVAQRLDDPAMAVALVLAGPGMMRR